MSFLAALERLDALGLELAPTTPRRKFELDHMRILARALGDPQTRFPSILIAGTNGKGSTAATLAGILTAAGLRTGLYTSPHLTRVTERIRVSNRDQGAGIRDRQPTPSDPEPFPVSGSLSLVPCSLLLEIPEAAFARLYFHVDTAAARLVATGQLPHPPSYFETLTALAFLYFAEQRIDIAVLEVGLGGRLDATNIVEPLVSVITDIALDHQEYLGNTLTEIAREKAGILRPNGTLITLPQHPEANHAIGEAAIALNVRAIPATPYLPDRTGIRDQGSGSGEPDCFGPAAVPCSLFPVPSLDNHYTLHLGAETLHVHSPLAGSHQQRNLALAIAAALELRNTNGYNITNAAIEAGIASTSWPGRLEFLAPNLILDVAHNPAGAWTLRAAIAQLPDTTPRTLIFSCLRDKDLREMSQILFALFDSATARYNLILTPIDSPRAASLDSLIAAARALDVPFHAATSPAGALALARRITPPSGLILATGSVYLIGALRALAL